MFKTFVRFLGRVQHLVFGSRNS